MMMRWRCQKMKKEAMVASAAGEIGRTSTFGSSNALWVSISSKFHVHLGHRWMMAFTTPEFFSSPCFALLACRCLHEEGQKRALSFLPCQQKSWSPVTLVHSLWPFFTSKASVEVAAAAAVWRKVAPIEKEGPPPASSLFITTMEVDVDYISNVRTITHDQDQAANALDLTGMFVYHLRHSSYKGHEYEEKSAAFFPARKAVWKKKQKQYIPITEGLLFLKAPSGLRSFWVLLALGSSLVARSSIGFLGKSPIYRDVVINGFEGNWPKRSLWEEGY